MNQEVNRNEVSQNIKKDEVDTRRIITRTVKFSMNEEAALIKKIKTCNEEALLLELEKRNNLRISFEGMKEIIENTVSKSNKVEHLRNEDQEGRIYSESTRIK